jgi:D-glycero-D-manno-heptose 1,7-bisphosphate phosphatase
LNGRPAVFLDRDGTLNRDVGYVTHLDDFQLYARAAAAVKRIADSGYAAILATNQAGVARGYFPEWMVEKVHEKLQSELAKHGAKLDAIYYCPHHPSSEDPAYTIDSEMRKPRPGMLLKAAKEHDLALPRSFMIGDKYSDMECGWAAGCRSAFVLTGYGRGEMELRGDSWPRKPDIIAEDVYAAVESVLEINREEGR